MVCVKYGLPLVVTAEDIEEYGSYELAAHGIKEENKDIHSKLIQVVFD